MKQKQDKFYSKEEAHNILSRIDSWVRNCDTKFSILLALLGIFFGLTINIFSSFTELTKTINNWVESTIANKFISIICCILVSSYIVLLILCIIFSVLGVSAKTKNKTKNPLFFFFISTNFNELKDFDETIKNITEEEYVSFLNEQIYTNSKICTKKYQYYKKAFYCLFPAIIIAIVSLVLLYI